MTGCSTPNTTVSNDTPPPASTTRTVTDNLVRYGSIGAGGATGFFAGKEIGGDNTSGAIGAGVGTLGMYGLNKFMDTKKSDAEKEAYFMGAAAARAERLNKEWEREAVYGLPREGTADADKTPQYRRVYVPERTVNGVTYSGGYQTVEVYK